MISVPQYNYLPHDILRLSVVNAEIHLYAMCTVPSAPQAPVLSARGDINPVGVLVVWNTVKSATSYSIEVVGLRLGTELTFSSIVPSYIIPSEAVGGFEMARVEVVAVNSAGYGPASEPSVERTPPISTW